MNYATMSTGRAAISRASKVLDEVVASDELESSGSQSSGSDLAHQGGERNHSNVGVHQSGEHPDGATADKSPANNVDDVDELIHREEEEAQKLEQQWEERAKLRKLWELRAKNSAKRKELQEIEELDIQQVQASTHGGVPAERTRRHSDSSKKTYRHS